MESGEINPPRPVAILRTVFPEKFGVPRQSGMIGEATGTVEFLPEFSQPEFARGLAGFSHVWLLTWFHQSPPWDGRATVRPPRLGGSERIGVFATRSPHRPNPIGLSLVRLLAVETEPRLLLRVAGVDAVDGTPVLDIKPYVPYTDAYPAARSGWLEEAAQAANGGPPADPLPPWTVAFAEPAAVQADWIAARTGLDLRARITATLALGPEPHPYRRIRREGDTLRLAVRDWRVRFVVEGRTVQVLEIASGYRAAQRAAGGEAPAVHREFAAAWPV